MLFAGPFIGINVAEKHLTCSTSDTLLIQLQITDLRGSLPKSGPLDFATKDTFPLFFGGEKGLVGIC